MHALGRWLVLAAIACASVGCPPETKLPETPHARQSLRSPAPADDFSKWQRSKTGLGFRASNAEPDAPVAQAMIVSPAALDDTSAKAILARLPAMKDDARVAPLPSSGMSPPKASKKIGVPFPPVQGSFALPAVTAPPPAASGALVVVRRSPEGAIPKASSIALTFSQPMVALGSLGDLAKSPARLTPEPAGTWQWVSPETLVFHGDAALPKATEITVDVPAGTRAASGAELASAVRWTFSTPPPALVASEPHGDNETTEPAILITMDQAIDPAAFLSSVELAPRDGGSAIPLRLATNEERAAEEAKHARRWEQGAADDRHHAVSLRVTAPLAIATTYRVRIKAGAPSAEGPRRSDKDQSFEFTTHGPLTVTGAGCGRRTTCTPLEVLEISTSNPIDPEAFKPEMVKVEPDIPEKKVMLTNYGGISIFGHTKGRTTYAIAIAPTLKDQFGQLLGKEAHVSVGVGPAEPDLLGDGVPMRILEPSAKRELAVFSVNEPKLHVRVYAVAPSDYPAYTEYSSTATDPKAPKLPGRLVVDHVVAPKKSVDEVVRTVIDLAPVLKKENGTLVGHAIVVVEPARPAEKGKKHAQIVQWIQATTIGVVSYTDADAVTAWATRLADGAAVADAEVSIVGGGAARTGKDGIARVPLVVAGGKLVVVKKGADSTFASSSFDASSYTKVAPEPHVRMFAFDDLGLHRPGEDVHIRGWMRRLVPQGDVVREPSLVGKKVAWALEGSALKGEAVIDDVGAVDIAFKIPADARTGDALVEMSIVGGPQLDGGEVAFSVQEYRRPDFDAKIDVLTPGPLFVGGHALAALRATYYGGGGVGGSHVTWTLGRHNVNFTPPGRSDLHFGPHDYRPIPHDADSAYPEQSIVWNGLTDATGTHAVRLDLDAIDPPYPFVVMLNGGVQDASHQQQSAFGEVLVHPASLYVGLRVKNAILEKGGSISVEALVTDLDGRAAPGRQVRLTSARLVWKLEKDGWAEHEEPAGTCELDSAAEPAPCALGTNDAGEYRVSAIVADDFGRKNQSSLDVWVTGEGAPKDRHVEGNEVTLVPAKSKLAPGEGADVLVVAPFTPAEGVYTLRRDGVVRVERFSMPNAMTTLHIPMAEGLMPNATLHVDLVGVRPRENDRGDIDPALPKKPAYAVGSVNLAVSAASRTLDVRVSPRAPEATPGSASDISVDVRDARGQPVADARVTVIAADEAVLALTGWRAPDPIASFYGARQDGVADSYSWPDMWLDAETDLELHTAAAVDPVLPSRPHVPGKTGVITISEITIVGKEQIHLREHFAALALFAPHVKTDAQGHASVPLKLPDDLTRYRITAVAGAVESAFGVGESAVTAALPLSARIDAPRFATYGDAFDVPVLVQNRTSAPLDVGVVMRATGATLRSASAVRVRVRANERVAVPFSVTTANGSTARFQVGLAAGTLSDAAEIAIPVHTAHTTESFATYGVLDEGATIQPFSAPKDVLRDVGGLEMSLSSTGVSALTDAFVYAEHYPYECNEQLASRIISAAALYDVLSAFHAEGIPSKEVLDRSMTDILHLLRSRQNEHGGWGFWRGATDVYLTLHVTHALIRARARGWHPPPEALEGAFEFLNHAEAEIPKAATPETRRAILAYAVYLNRLRHAPVAARARKLIADAGGADKLPLDAIGWIWPTISEDKDSLAENQAIRAYVANHVKESAGSAHFVVDHSDADQILLRSDQRADGILLEALIADQPQSPLIPKLAKGLLDHRTAGHWASTHENAFALVGLARYFDTFEKATPKFTARAWLGGALASEHAFIGREADTVATLVPMSFVADKAGDVIVAKDGPGRLYYRLAMTYAPSSSAVPPIDRGFTVSRSYQGVEHADDVTRDADGTWRVRAGAKVRVRVSIVTPTDRHHVALVDPLPAGFEGVSGALGPEGFGGWPDFDELRDDRAQAFATNLPGGVHEYTYLARATATGTFTAAPPRAEEMYSPEIFGRGKSERVIVE